MSFKPGDRVVIATEFGESRQVGTMGTVELRYWNKKPRLWVSVDGIANSGFCAEHYKEYLSLAEVYNSPLMKTLREE